MDRFYDRERAAERLDGMAKDRRELLNIRVNSSAVHMADMQTDDLRVMELTDGKQNWRLCLQDTEDDVSDEMVVRIQGVLTKNNLVPKNTRMCSQQKAQFLSQSAEITGLRTDTFAIAIGNLTAIEQKFGEHLPGTDVVGSECGNIKSCTFAASNRIFTSQGDAPTEQDTAFHEGVDPMGHMARLKTGDLIHAPDNMVKYFKRAQVKGSNSFRYEPYVPGGFKIGDIVEMQVSFVAIAAGTNRVKVTSRLQALTLLDHKFAKEASEERRRVLAVQEPSPAIRRKVGYFAEDEEDERKIKRSRSRTPERDAGPSG
ncbi:hypothetical protein C8F04DRAFT_1262050 [Mycena alexandri]|uniref:Uncharacterized protein n=1 Tax=Mycena alexandri TaxID=1745969 RepID=A0AAD6X0Q4_9AGAR|nr:hypothetical protein C8F04DRAFT_1262050 [Mycena alexandri]